MSRSHIATFIKRVTLNTNHKRKNGSLYPVEIHAVVIKYDDDEYVISTIRDLTIENAYREELYNQKKFLDTILENIDDAVVACDPLGNIKYFNNAARLLHHSNTAELFWNESIQESKFFHADGITSMQKDEIPLYRSLEEDSVHDAEIIIRPKEGEDTYLISNAVKMKDANGKCSGAVSISHDITQLKLAMKKEKAANSSKSIFLANMSHEIRTPMNAILGFTSLLSKNDLSPKQQEYLHTIESSAKVLLEIINDILDLSKIESGKMKFTSTYTNIEAMINDMQELFSLQLVEKGIGFNINTKAVDTCCVLIDELRLRQILLNVIGNAVKFTQEGEIDVNVTLKNKKLVLSISDTGMGVKDDQKETIFDSFIQQDNQEYKNFGGTGLGLAICKQLCVKMGGDIYVEDNPKGGSIFIIEFNNIDTENIKEVEKVETPSLELPKATILIVDDILTNRLLLNAYFDESNITTIEAKDGVEAIEMAKKHIPDLILMDIKMPVMDGIEATKILKEDLITKEILICALTADIVDKEKDEILKHGFDQVLTKPIAFEELFATIKVLLKS